VFDKQNQEPVLVVVGDHDLRTVLGKRCLDVLVFGVIDGGVVALGEEEACDARGLGMHV
jgi:hypothetical protein